MTVLKIERVKDEMMILPRHSYPAEFAKYISVMPIKFNIVQQIA